MKEYRVVYNAYDGKGNITYETGIWTVVKAIEIKAWVDMTIVNEQGKCWIEERLVGDWREVNL